MASDRAPSRWVDAAGFIAAVAGPLVLTAVVVRTGARERDYIFLYMGLVAVIAVLRGLPPSLLAAGSSFLLVDYFFVPPYHTLTIGDEQDLVNLTVFFGTAGLVGVLASRRWRALMETRALARQLQQANRELVRLNQEQAQAAQAALRLARTERQVQALQQSERNRQELFANVSHDLRTPISTILTETTGMLQSDELGSPARERLETVVLEARRLGALVSDMLDMARIEGGALALEVEPIQASDAIGAAAERLRRTSPNRDVEWNRETAAVHVLADWDRLGQIFDNLLSNADRFAPPGTAVRVQVSQEDAGYVAIRVIDSGPGVPPEIRDRLFSRFVTAPRDGSSPQQGTGLGLAIARGLVEAHAGTIALEDPSPGGASFRFTLPKAET